jgi:hypothetical protein
MKEGKKAEKKAGKKAEKKAEKKAGKKAEKKAWNKLHVLHCLKACPLKRFMQ